MVNRLDSALQIDSTVSRSFKWKFSRLFHELRQLFAGERSRQNKSPMPPATTHMHPDPFATVEAPSRISSPVTSEAARSLKIEELNPPNSEEKGIVILGSKTISMYLSGLHVQLRFSYMCLECPISTTDGFYQHYCSFCSMPYLNIDMVKAYNLQCQLARMKGKTFARKDKLSEHLEKDHTIPKQHAQDQAVIWSFAIESHWPRQCGFCYETFDNWDLRASHLIEDHFKKGESIKSWRIPVLESPPELNSRFAEPDSIVVSVGLGSVPISLLEEVLRHGTSSENSISQAITQGSSKGTQTFNNCNPVSLNNSSKLISTVNAEKTSASCSVS